MNNALKERNPGQYLPTSPEQWRQRIRELVQELRRPDLTPCRGVLYEQVQNNAIGACVEGVINEMAIRGGVPATWEEYDLSEDDELTRITWEILPPDDPRGAETESVPTALPEALLYHGFNIEDGGLCIDVLECDNAFIREVVNGRHNTSFGAAKAATLNDRMMAEGVNTLLLTADIFEHLMERPNRNIWHHTVNPWHSRQ
jgi:hypothetical protein